MNHDNFHKLISIEIWVNEKTKTLFPCNPDGSVLIENGIHLNDLNQECYNYLDNEDKIYLTKIAN